MKKKAPKVIEYNARFAAHGYSHVRWVENASRGLRLVGFADEIAREEGRPRMIDHRGWYTDEDGSNGERYRGVVYQLPSRGAPVYVYGYADPINEGCALLDFTGTSDKMEAARYADGFAERFAEEQRTCNEAWEAGRRAEEINDEIAAARKQALAIGDEMRKAKRAHVEAPTICATLRAEILSLYRTIQKMREEREDLILAWGEHPSFAG